MQAHTNLTQHLAATLAEPIRRRLLQAGARMPSVRECARLHRVSPSTVVAAYDQLMAQGLVESAPKRGFFVRAQRTGGPPPAGTSGLPAEAHASPGGSQTPRPVDATALIRGMFAAHSMAPEYAQRLQPSLGVLPASWLDTPFLGSALRRFAQGDSFTHLSLNYGDPAGDLSLRQALVAHLATIGVQVGAGQIITTIGANQALDVAARTLLKPGDAVMVEDPGWAVEFARLSQMGMRLLPVPRLPQGPDLSAVERWCTAPNPADRPKLFVSVSVLHNPTGGQITPATAHRLLALAQAHSFMVLEDDTYGHFAPTSAVRVAALDSGPQAASGGATGLDRCILVGGFAKVLAPNWRVGFMAAPQRWVEPLTDTKLINTLTTPAIAERAIAHCLAQGQVRRHAQRVNERLAQARQRSVRQARAQGFDFAVEPNGLFGWLETGVDTQRLAQRMLPDGWLLAPGALFHAEPASVRGVSTHLRVNFATTQDAAFWQALRAAVG
jgi:DNA-binding transcriptional MocR family regulator